MSELGHDIRIITHSVAVGSVARRHGNKDLLKIVLFMSSAAYHLTGVVLWIQGLKTRQYVIFNINHYYSDQGSQVQ